MSHHVSLPHLYTILPEGERGTVSIRHFHPNAADRARLAREEGEAMEDRVHVELRINRQLVMSDSAMEYRTNREVIRRAHGNVLIGGLGLGMILRQILGKPDVDTVTVVERNADVIQLVAPFFAHPNLIVLHGDIHTWEPPEGVLFHTIYFDIWPTRGDSQREGFDTLRRRYRFMLDKSDPERWLGCWYEAELKAERRREARRLRREREVAALPPDQRAAVVRAQVERALRRDLSRRGFSPARIHEYMERFGRDIVDREMVLALRRSAHLTGGR